MGDVNSTPTGGMDRSARGAIRRTTYSKILRDPKWVKQLSDNSEAGDTSIWKYTFQNPQPAFIVNPKFGTCLIWSRETNIHPVTRERRLYYLVTFTRAVKSAHKKPKAVTPTIKGKKRIRFDKFYKVPATITMPYGDEVEYIIPLQIIISKIYNCNSSDTDMILLDVRSREKIERMTLSEFQKIMNAKPPVENTENYRHAYYALYATNPAYVATHLLSTQVITSKDADMYLISNASKNMVEDIPQSTAEQAVGDEPADLTEGKIGSIFQLPFSSSSFGHSQQQQQQQLIQTPNTLHMFHPIWYKTDQTFLRKFDSIFIDKELDKTVVHSPDFFNLHDSIIEESIQRIPGKDVFGDIKSPPSNHISYYNNYVQ